jgi:nitrogen regulatory protein PII
MNVLFIVLNDLAYLDEILAKLIDLKVRGATIIDSQGMATAVLNSEGLAMYRTGPFQRSPTVDQKYSKTIFTVIQEEETLTKVVAAIRKIVDNANHTGVGFMFSLPVGGVYPMKPHIK